MFKKLRGIFKKEESGDYPADKPRSNKILPISLLLVLIIVVVGFAAMNFNKSDKSDVLKISLAAKNGDLNGIEKNTAFVLKANQKLSEGEIKQYLKFEPQVDYKVSSGGFGFLSLAKSFLANNQNESLNVQYEITPQKELNAGEVYKVAASSTEALLDHQYSWAFQVKDQFDIKESMPTDKAVGVNVKSGIEIIFNRLAIGKNAEEFFSIEPVAPGRFEVGANKITFIPETDLREKTLYKITIKKGYQAGEKKEALAEDKIFTFETSAAENSAIPPYLYLNNGYSEMTPDKIGYLEASGIATSSEMTAYKFANTNDFIADYYKYQDRANNWSNYNQEKFVFGTNPAEVFKFQPVLLRRDEGNNFGLIKLPQKLETGFYVFKLTTGDSTVYSFARVSPLAYFYSETNGDGLIWAYDLANKKAFSNIKLYSLDKEGKEKELGVTDENGLVKFDSSSDFKEDKDFSLIFRGENFAESAVPNIGYMFEKKRNYFQGFLNTDRYAYRLTDKVRFWGVVRGRSFDLKEKKVKISLDGLVEKEVVVSPFDTIEGEISFAGLPSGNHSILVSYNDEIITSSNIEVFNFEKPLYKINVETGKTFATAGETVKAKIKVNFFDGTPVKNMELNYAIDWREQKTGVIKTNDQGEAELSYVPEYYFEERSDEYSVSWTTYPMPLRFTVRPTLGEEGEIWGEAYVNVYGANINLQTEKKEQDNLIVFRAKINKLNLANSTEEGIIGQAVAGQAVRVKIDRYYYEQIPDGETYDPIEKVKVKRYRYETRKQLIKEANGITDQQGEWQIGIDKKEVKENGYLKATFSTEDEKGKKVMGSAESYNYYPGNEHSYLSLTNLDLEQNKNSYKVNDQVNLKASLSGKEKSIDNRTLIIRFQEGLRGAEFINQDIYKDNFSKDHLPSMSYMAVKVMPNGFLHSDSITASFDEQQQKLNIDIKADKESYRPREDINLSINIKDKDNKANKAVANVAAVDEALFSVSPWAYTGDILGSLYNDISAYPNVLSTSYVTNFKDGAELGGCFVGGTKINMSDGGQKNIEDINVGDEIKTLASETSETRANSIIQGVSSHLVDGYLLINDKLKVTPEHKIYLNGSWELAGEAKVGDYLIDFENKKELISSIKYIKSRDIKVYNIVVGRFHTYFADGYYVHNAEKGGGGDARNFFQDTPLYKQFEADENGAIKASFKAPDNLTSWRISVNAYNPTEFKAGNNDKLVAVGLPLFVDAVMAKQYLSGDSPVIKIRVFGNQYKKDQPVEFGATSETLKINFSTTTKAGEIYLPLGKLAIGKHKITFSAKQGELKDALEKNFTVFENYVTKFETDNRLVKDGAIDLRANAGGFTNVMFVDDGKGKYFNKLLALNWQGSIRADIQSAAYLAAKTLNEYFYNGEEHFGADLNLSDYQNHQNVNNILTLFPYGAADYALTGKLADVVADKFDRSTVSAGLNAKLNEQELDQVEISQALYALAALEQPELPMINYLKNHASTTDEAKLYLALALEKIGDGEGAREIYNAISPLLKIDNDKAYLEIGEDKTKNIKFTAVFGILMSKLENGNNENASKLLTYLENNPPVDDSTALEQAMIIKNLIINENQIDSSFAYQTDSRKEKVDLSKGQSLQLTLAEAELKTLTFSEVKGQPRVISFYEVSANLNELAKSNQVAVKKSFLVDNKDATEFKEGDLVMVRIDPQFAKEAPDGNYQITDYLPAGLKPVIREYNPNLPTSNECNTIWYPIRTTENAIYFNIGKWFEKTANCPHRTLNYHVRAVNKGDYKAQGTVIQSLNTLEVMNIAGEKTVRIK